VHGIRRLIVAQISVKSGNHNLLNLTAARCRKNGGVLPVRFDPGSQHDQQKHGGQTRYLRDHCRSVSCHLQSVADPEQAFGGGSQIGGRQEGFTCLNTRVCLRKSLGVTQKCLPFVGQKVAIFVSKTMLFFREKTVWKRFILLIQKRFETGPKIYKKSTRQPSGSFNALASLHWFVFFLAEY